MSKSNNTSPATSAAIPPTTADAQVELMMRIAAEDYGFVEILDKFKRYEFAHQAAITICKSPLSLALVGADISLDLIINPSAIVKCMSSPTPLRHGHELDRDIFKYLVFELRSPVMVFQGTKEGSFVFVTDLKDRVGRPVVVVVAKDRRNGHTPVNQVVSAYGRSGFDDYLKRQVRNGRLIAVNKNKANQMFQSSGHSWPIEETLISFDNSISYTLENVKGLDEKYYSIPRHKKVTTRTDIAQSEASEGLPSKTKEEVDRLRRVIADNEKLVDMIRFFEYAGEDIYESMLWRQFQQDKPFLTQTDTPVSSRLSDVLMRAKQALEPTHGRSPTAHNQEHDPSLDVR